MSIRFNLVQAAGMAMTLALVAGGCALADGADESDDADPSKVEQVSTEFEYAPDDVDVPLSKEVADDGLAAKGSIGTRKRGPIFHQGFPLNQGDALSCTSSSDGTSGVDTVMAIVRCGDNGACWPSGESSYEAQQGLTTLALNDDIDWPSNPYSNVGYTAGYGHYVYVLGFAYGDSIGTATVDCTINGGSVVSGSQSFRGGSNQTSCGAGAVHTTGGGDPMLIAIESAIGGGAGLMNDDVDYCPSGCNRESHLTGLTNKSLWFINHGYNEGDTTVECP
jgi:hypothetical protein